MIIYMLDMHDMHVILVISKWPTCMLVILEPEILVNAIESTLHAPV